MPNPGEHHGFNRAEAFLPRHLDLPKRAVLIVLALHDQHGHTDVPQGFGDVPFLEVGMQPGLVPAAERGIDIGVVGFQPFPQRAGIERFAGAPDFRKPHLFGKKMRRDQNDAANPMILDAAGIDRGNRGAIAVAEQKSAAEADRVKHARQHLARFLIHERGRAWQRGAGRVAVTGAGIGKDAGAGGRCDLVRELAPQADAAEPLMQHHDRGPGVGPWPDHAVFEPQRPQIEKAGVGQRHGRAPPAGARRSAPFDLSKSLAIRMSLAELCSTVSPEVSSCACARA